MPKSKQSYKSYFRSTISTPTSIPRRTRYRWLKPRRLQLEPELSNDEQLSFDEVLEDENNTLSESTLTKSLCNDDDSSADSDSSSEFYDGTTKTDALLFQNARITSKESLLMIYSYLIRHKLSNVAAKDLLTLINFHLPLNASIPTSMFLLEKQLSPDYSTATKTYYCPKCEAILDSSSNNCTDCNESYQTGALLKQGSFFISFNVRSSLESLLQLPNITESLSKNLYKRRVLSDLKTDVMDGECYRKLKLQFADLTCCVNTDGVSIFSSSSLSIWPILISMNELGYALRRTYTLLVGLWFGNSKPTFNSFLLPFVSQCNELSNIGISWSHQGSIYTSKIYFPIIAADSVARCSLQGIKQFNGEYGCPWCLSKGETFLEKGSRKWIYPPGEHEPRSREQFLSHLRTLKHNMEFNDSENCFGVKSASQLITLRKFDIVDGFVFDYMHTCLLGVVKIFTNKWIESKHHGKDFYIGTKVDDISDVFARVKVPNKCNRVTRTLKDIRYWKANEWKTWMMVCVPVLQNIQKPVYLVHFAKLVNAVMLLNSTSISAADLTKSKQSIKEFCYVAPKLYGKDISTFNMHLLLHMVRCVENWGPLWAYSLFQFEHINGILTSYFAGTNQICMQIVKKAILTKQIMAMGEAKFQNNVAAQYFECMIKNKRFCLKSKQSAGITVLGAGRLYNFNERECRKLEKLQLSEIHAGTSYKSCIISGQKFTVSQRDTEKRLDSVVEINDRLYLLMKIILVKQGLVESSIIIVKKIVTTPVAGLYYIKKVVNVLDSVKVFNASEIELCKFVCSFSATGNLLYVFKLSNVLELE